MERLDARSTPVDPVELSIAEGGPSAADSARLVPWNPLLRVLAGVVVLLTVLGPVVDLADDLVPEADGPVRGALDILQRWFTLDAEASIPSWFSVSVLLLLAGALALIALCQRAMGAAAGRYWLLTAVALYLSLDEAASLHEEAGRVTGQFVDRASVGTYTWVVPGALIALVVGVALLRLARGLPARMRLRLVVAGVVYLGGALVVEALSGTVSDSAACLAGSGSCVDAGLNLPYTALNTLEELLEMSGAVLAVRAALLQLQLRVAPGGLLLSSAAATGAPSTE